jgi:hypothetical protein
MCLDEAGQESFEPCRRQTWHVRYFVKLGLHEVMLALEPAEHHTDRRRHHTAAKNQMPWIELVIDSGLVKEAQHLGWRYDKAALWLVVFNDVDGDSSQKLAQSCSGNSVIEQRLPDPL